MKTGIFTITACLATALILTSARALENEYEYTVYRMEAPVVLDGRLDEDAWNYLPVATGFRILGNPFIQPDKLAPKQTIFRMGWDAEFLYIGAKCMEPDINDLESVKKDGAVSWKDNSVEIFMRPAPPDFDHQLIVKIFGTKNWRGETNKLWEAKTVVEKGAWTMEIKIPLSELGKMPAENTTWPFNMARNIITAGNNQSDWRATDRYTTWAPLKGRFHDFDHFGAITFSSKTLGREDVETINMELNQRLARPLVANTRKIMTKCRRYMDEIKTDSPSAELPMQDELEGRWSLLNAAASKNTLTLQEAQDAQQQAKELLAAISKQYLTVMVAHESK